jgi:hypothetical protein
VYGVWCFFDAHSRLMNISAYNFVLKKNINRFFVV